MDQVSPLHTLSALRPRVS